MPVTAWILKFNSAERLEHRVIVFRASLALTWQQSLAAMLPPR